MTTVSNPEAYCREIEAYLCRKNDGHLIRIVGPAFEQVSAWARDGVPLTIAFAGIDRYFDRYYRKGARRRPVRIEFCEADVLDVFDDWRRAVGVTLPIAGAQAAVSPSAGDEPEAETGVRRRISLGTHVERVIARLTALRGSSQSARIQKILEQVARELDTLQPDAKRVRGAAREALIARLGELDAKLLAGVVAAISDPTRRKAEADAKEALGPFRDRMAPEAYKRACAAAFDRHLRLLFGLPTIAFDR